MKIKGLYHMPGSRFLWYRWSSGGKRYAVSLKTDDLSEAVKKVQEIKTGKMFTKLIRAEAAPTPASKIVEKYLLAAQQRRKKPMRLWTANKQGRILYKFLRDFSIEKLHEITREKIDEFLAKLLEQGRSADTIHTNARVIHTFVRYIQDHRLISDHNLDKFDIPERASTGRKNWLKMEVVNKVIAASKDPDLTFILFCGFHAGLRKSEIAMAKVAWFDQDAGLLHAQNDPDSGFVLKDRENRTIPLTHAFLEFLRGYLANRDGNEFVLNPRSTTIPRGEYRIDFRRRVQSHFKVCNVSCTIHDMRRSFASNLVSRGESVYIVARWLGDGVQVVERSYGHLAQSAGNINALSNPL